MSSAIHDDQEITLAAQSLRELLPELQHPPATHQQIHLDFWGRRRPQFLQEHPEFSSHDQEQPLKLQQGSLDAIRRHNTSLCKTAGLDKTMNGYDPISAPTIAMSISQSRSGRRTLEASLAKDCGPPFSHL